MKSILPLMLALATACASKSDPVAKVKAYADKVCACADTSCAKPIWEEFKAWLHASAEKNPDLDKAYWEFLKAMIEKNGGSSELVPPGKGAPSGVPGMDRILKCASDKNIL